MSLRPQPWPEPSGEITRVVMAIYAGRRAPMPMAARDVLGEVPPTADPSPKTAKVECSTR